MAAAALAAVAAAAVWAPAAEAGRGATVIREVQLGEAPAARAARCPVGTRATGGGFAIGNAFNPATGAGARSWIQASHPTDIRTYRSVASPVDQHQPATRLRTFVRCIRSTQGPVAIGASPPILVQPGVIQPTTAECPRASGLRAISGGFQTTPPYSPPSGGEPVPLVLESRRAGAYVWRTQMVNVGFPGATAAQYRHYGVCERIGNGATRVRSRTVLLPPDQRRDVVVKCPRGWHTASGGFRLSPISETDTLFAFVDRSHPIGSRGWRAGAWTANIGGIEPEGGRLSVYAYCKRN